MHSLVMCWHMFISLGLRRLRQKDLELRPTYWESIKKTKQNPNNQYQTNKVHSFIEFKETQTRVLSRLCRGNGIQIRLGLWGRLWRLERVGEGWDLLPEAINDSRDWWIPQWRKSWLYSSESAFRGAEGSLEEGMEEIQRPPCGRKERPPKTS